ncbi:hypothetical protein DU504_08605 [Haloplanus salinus]|jgi:hypothetical protein|uniref:Uncharacterized protein n=2 Tax=Haloplanus salinus TaxID=1126245 RepID=A0A368NBG9_9EURY|nr:hypothetical protein DU504_08605 [Haloplanus salinus]
MLPPALGTVMNRRTMLRTTPLLALSGCVGTGGGGDGGGDDSPRVTGRSFEDTGECSDAETATADDSDGEVRIEGCVTGPNGCAVAALGSAAVGDGVLEVVVTTERDAPPDVACTEALVYRAYVATITTDGEVSSVRVVHDAPGGRETVVDTAA